MTQPPYSPYPDPDPDPGSGQPIDPYANSAGQHFELDQGPPPQSFGPGGSVPPQSGPPYAPGPPQPGQAGMYPPPPPPDGAPPAPPFLPPEQPSSKSKGPVIIGISIGTVAIVGLISVCCLALNFEEDDKSNADGGSDDSSSSEEEKVDDSIIDAFDPNNTQFWNVSQGVGTEKLELKDGKYDDGSNSARVKVAEDPVFSDADDDGDLDAAVMLQDAGDEGEDNSWKEIHIWLWDGDEAKPVQEYAAWQWDCVDSDFSVEEGSKQQGFKITRDEWNQCDDSPSGETINVAVQDDTPVIVAGDYRGATETCWVSEDSKHNADLAGVSDPLVIPDPNAAKLGDTSKQKEVLVSVEDWDSDSFNGYVIVVVAWEDGTQTCGWVPWQDYKDNS